MKVSFTLVGCESVKSVRNRIINIMVRRDKAFLKLKKQIENCKICQKNFGFKPRPIFWGSHKSKIIHISQAPSLNVHKTQYPFNDKSGERLRKEWYQVSNEDFYNPHNFYITAIAHCYPGRNKSGGDQKPPKICAEKWLLQELKLLKPKLFLVVGSYATHFFFPTKKLSKLVFEDIKISEIPCFVLPHPSSLNRKWFKDNPEFGKKKLPEIRRKIKEVIEN